ncbi:MAG: hypothetical protein RBR50_06135 [Candidatus Izemoplasmatales bacterium]|jgi:hypothetical protein|nr:hypothetical protein [Candidatus Izemoplasmatales bacterium]
MEYLSKNATKVNRQEFKKIFDKLSKNLGDNWSINYRLVGSAKRNLVLVGNEGYDLDYHIYLQKSPSLSDHDIKVKFKTELDKIVKTYNLIPCEDSTHVLTTKKLDGTKLIYAYDVAIMRKNKNDEYLILKNEKTDNNGNGPYHFVEVPKASDFANKYNTISGIEQWKKLRSIYKGKKESQQNLSKDLRKHSFSLLIEAVNETIS